MRLMAVVSILLCQQAMALNWRATTRADHKSLDIVVRRLEGVDNPQAIASLHHLKPMLARHGGPVRWWQGRIDIGSEEERQLVMAHHGYARTQVTHEELQRDIAFTLMQKVTNLAWGILLGAGLPGIGLVILYVLYRNRGTIIKAFDQDAEKLPPETRRQVFTSPEVQKEHAKLKGKKP